MYEALVKRLRVQADAERYFVGEDMLYDKAADARSVVLCRDCKCYQQSSFVDKHMECARSRFPVHPVDFCSLGEKREES